jgi:hypothetical protein
MGGAPGHRPTENDLEKRIDYQLVSKGPNSADFPRRYTVKKLNLRDAQEAAMMDPDLLDQRELIAIIDARLQELFDQADYRDSSAIWNDLESTQNGIYTTFENLRAQVLAFDRASKAADAETARKALLDLMALIQTTIDNNTSPLNKQARLISEGSEQWAVWADIFRTIDNRRKLNESQRSREKELKTLIPAAEVEANVANMYDDYIDAVRELAPPELQTKLLNAVATRWRKRFSNLERVVSDPDGNKYVR